VRYSADGVTWNSSSVSPAANLTAVWFRQPIPSLWRFGAGGAAYTSPDGITWTARSTGTTANLWGMISAQVQYLAVG